jgi:hypothetical protein
VRDTLTPTGRAEQERSRAREKSAAKSLQCHKSACSSESSFSLPNKLTSPSYMDPNPLCQRAMQHPRPRCGALEIPVAGTQVCGTPSCCDTIRRHKEIFSTHYFPLDCPPSRLRVSKPATAGKRSQACLLGHLVLVPVPVPVRFPIRVPLAQKPSLRWNESCCALAEVDTLSPVALLHGWGPRIRPRSRARICLRSWQ